MGGPTLKRRRITVFYIIKYLPIKYRRSLAEASHATLLQRLLQMASAEASADASAETSAMGSEISVTCAQKRVLSG